MRTLTAVLLLTFISQADYMQFGSPVYPVNRPFCGDCNQSLRDQILVPSDSLGSAMVVNSIAFLIESGETVSFDQFVIHMGITELDELTDTFENNWMPGTRQKVYDHSNVTYNSPGSGEWMAIDLDTPFWYNGEDNLVMEFSWPQGTEVLMIWAWIPDGNNSLYAGWGEPTGNLIQECLMMRLEGTLSLSPGTFGGIKATLGR